MPDVIVGFEYGDLKSFGNVLLTYALWSTSKEFEGTPVVVQDGIRAHALNLPEYAQASSWILAPMQDEGHTSTYDVAHFVARLAVERHWKSVLVVAAPQHRDRCVRDLKQLGLEATWVALHPYQPRSFYDFNSGHWWTRNKFFWWIREWPLRKLPWPLYVWLTRSFSGEDYIVATTGL